MLQIKPIPQLLQEWSEPSIDPKTNQEIPGFLSERVGYPTLTDRQKSVMAVLLENEKQDYLLAEKTETGDIQKYEPVLVSVIRRGFPQLIGMDLFGVQPMTGPSGLVFCMKTVYHNNTAYPVKASNSCVMVLGSAAAFVQEGAITSNGSGAGVGVVRYKEGNTVLVEITSGSFAEDDSVDNANPFVSAETTISSYYDNEAHFRFLFKEYGKFANVAAAEAATTGIRELGMVIEKVTVTADNYRLKAKFTDELAQDLKSVHGMDADAELTKALGNEVAVEMNKRFLDKLIEKAQLGGTSTFNYLSIDEGGDADGRWSLEKTWSMIQKFNKTGNQIAKDTLRGRGNFIVCSLDVASMIESLPMFKHYGPGNTDYGIGDVNLGNSAFIGTLGHKYKVYVDIYATSNYCVVGYKGTSEWDAGLYYCPYVPLTIKKGIGEEDGQPRIWFQTRYGLGENPFGAHLYYRYITITNL